MRKLLSILKNKYLLVLLFAAIWIVLIDNYNIRAQFRMKDRIEQLERDRAHYQSKIDALDFEREKLFNDPEEMERYARENYFMKRPSEEVFIVSEE